MIKVKQEVLNEIMIRNENRCALFNQIIKRILIATKNKNKKIIVS